MPTSTLKLLHFFVPAFSALVTCALVGSQATKAENEQIQNRTKSKNINSQTEWCAVQKNLLGVQTICWTDSAIRIACENNGYVIVSRAPFSKIYGFRDDDKVYTTSTLHEFRSQYPPVIVPKRNSRIVKLETKQIESTKLSHYCVTLTHAMLDVTFLESPRIPQQVADIVLAYYREALPSYGLLYAVHRGTSSATAPKLQSWRNNLFTPRDEAHDILITQEVKQIPYHASDFDFPKTYRLVGTEGVFSSKAQREQLSEIFKTMDPGRGLGKK